MAHYTRHQLSTTADGQPRLRHGRNRHGEGPLQHGPAQTIHVSGYDASTHTVWQFYGCLLPRCPTCYPRRLKTHRQTQPCHTPWSLGPNPGVVKTAVKDWLPTRHPMGMSLTAAQVLKTWADSTQILELAFSLSSRKFTNKETLVA